MRPLMVQRGSDRDVLPLGKGDQIGRLDAQGICDPVQPADGDGARAGLQPTDRLGGGGRLAAVGDFLKRQPPGAADLPDARDHENYLQTGSVRSFLHFHPDGKSCL